MRIVTTSDDCRLHWVDAGSGPPILLVHGYISTIERNWRGPGWIRALTEAGFRVMAYDQRGHGKSDKRYDPADYASKRLVEDACAILDAASVERAVIFGYSMGARIALEMGLTHPERCLALILAGMGDNFPDFGGPDPDPEAVARALEAENPVEIPERARGYRSFGERGGADLKAMAAVYRRARRPVSPEELSRVRLPTLVLVGALDGVAGNARPLAQAIPGAEHVEIPGKDHMSSVGAKESRAAVLSFLTRLFQDGITPRT